MDGCMAYGVYECALHRLRRTAESAFESPMAADLEANVSGREVPRATKVMAVTEALRPAVVQYSAALKRAPRTAHVLPKARVSTQRERPASPTARSRKYQGNRGGRACGGGGER